MSTIDSSTPAGVQPNGFSSGWTISMSDEFNSTTLDTKWFAFRNFGDFSTPTAYDLNNGNNSLLRMWYDGGTGHAADMIFGSVGTNPFHQRFGFYEMKARIYGGSQTYFPAFWLYPFSNGHSENPDGQQQEIDILECFPVNNGDWLVDTSSNNIKNGSFTVWTEGGGGATTNGGQRFIGGHTDPITGAVGAYVNTLSTQMHTYGLEWDQASGRMQWYLDGVARGSPISDPWGSANNMQLAVFLQLWWGPGGGMTTATTGNTPTDHNNPHSYDIDYVRVWTLGGGGGGGGPPPFSAVLNTAPNDGATINGNVAFQISGAAIANAELLPSTGYLPQYGVFTITNTNTKADLNWNTSAVANGSYTVRISAFDQAPGVSPANEIVAMAARTYIVSNTAAPLSLSAVPYGRLSSGFDALTFQDDFNSGSTPNATTWTNHFYYEAASPTINYDISGGNLRIWPALNAASTFFDRTITTESFFTQQYGYFEVEAQMPVGDGLHPVIGLIANGLKDIGYMHAYTNAPIGGWSSASHAIDYAVASYNIPTDTFDFEDRPGAPTLGNADLSSAMHKYAVEWTPTNLVFLFDGVVIDTRAQTFTGAYYPYIGLHMQTNESTANVAGTPQGTGNSMKVNYIRAWTLHNNANSVSGPPPPPVSASASASAADQLTKQFYMMDIGECPWRRR